MLKVLWGLDRSKISKVSKIEVYEGFLKVDFWDFIGGTPPHGKMALCLRVEGVEEVPEVPEVPGPRGPRGPRGPWSPRSQVPDNYPKSLKTLDNHSKY